ncbi:MAG: excisionase family DNA-binding protein [Candidatus Wallbacteria bacterium]
MSKSLNEYPEILNARNIAEYLNIGYVKALKLLKYGNLPCIRIGNSFRISRAVFEKWMLTPSDTKITY